MGFKLRLRNVQQGSGKASPFKINDSLVMGAGIAAKSFNNLGGGYNQGLNQTVPQVDESGGGTGGSEVAAKKPTCAETGLTGKALETCQENINKEFLDNDKKRLESEAAAKKEKICKETINPKTDKKYKSCQDMDLQVSGTGVDMKVKVSEKAKKLATEPLPGSEVFTTLPAKDLPEIGKLPKR
jgi:hypothetical protein